MVHGVCPPDALLVMYAVMAHMQKETPGNKNPRRTQGVVERLPK
jgi:hypothetical protein